MANDSVAVVFVFYCSIDINHGVQLEVHKSAGCKCDLSSASPSCRMSRPDGSRCRTRTPALLNTRDGSAFQ